MTTTQQIRGPLPIRTFDSVRLRAASPDDHQARRFAGVAYSGGELVINAVRRFIDLATLKIPKLPLPLMDGDNDAARIGVVEQARTEGGTLRIEGRLLDASPAARGLVQDMRDGFPLECAVNVVGGEWRTIPRGHRRLVNGRTINGPAEVVYNASLRAAISVCTSADPDSTIALLGERSNAVNQSRPIRRPVSAALSATNGGAVSATRRAAKPKPRTATAPKPAAVASLLTGGEFSPTALPADPDRGWRGCVALRAAYDGDREAFDRQVKYAGDWRRFVSDDSMTLALAIADPRKVPALAWEACPTLRRAEVAALCATYGRKADDPETVRLARAIFLKFADLSLHEGASIFARLGDEAKKPGALAWQPPRRAVEGRSSRTTALRRHLGGGDKDVLLAALALDMSDRHAALAGAGLRELAGA